MMASSQHYDVILCNVPVFDFSFTENIHPHLGLLYIATYLERNGISAVVINDPNSLNIIEAFLSSLSVKLIGFSINSDNQLETLRYCRSLKSAYPEVPIILGGPLVLFLDDCILEDNVADYLCIGEGEQPVLALIRGFSASCIPGLMYFDEFTNHIVTNPPKPLARLDDMPIPNRDLLYHSTPFSASYISTSRGCPFECSFCFESLTHTIRYHSVQRVIDEIKYLREKYNTTYFVFSDDNFMVNKKRLLDLCHAFQREFKPHEDFFWFCEGRVDAVSKDAPIVRAMRAAGMVRIQLGIESGNQAVLNAYNKNITPSQSTDAVSICYDANVLSVFSNFIIGAPNETHASLDDTVSLIKNLFQKAPGCFECSYSFLAPYRGTSIEKHSNELGLDIIDPKHYCALSTSYVSCTSVALSKEDLLAASREFNRIAYQTMISQLPKVTAERISAHLCATQYGLRTKWAHLLTFKDEMFSNFSTLIKKPYIVRSCNAYANGKRPDHNLIPTRTFPLTRIKDDSLHIRDLGRAYRFATFLEKELVELAGGKLTLADIIDIVRDYFPGVNRDTLKIDVADFYQQLSDELLIVYRTHGG